MQNDITKRYLRVKVKRLIHELNILKKLNNDRIEILLPINATEKELENMTCVNGYIIGK
jgi:hypothetical protein